MGYNWYSCPGEIKDYVYTLTKSIKGILKDNYRGVYLHGSLAMGGFNPRRSDVDVLVITKIFMTTEVKRDLARFCLHHSYSPFALEISFICEEHLKHWQHPCPFDLHYSEFWRERYTEDLLNDTYQFLNDEVHADNDLAAHMTIINHRGVYVDGDSINEVFPLIPKSDYVSSILGDYVECLERMEEDPIYCSLNVLRVLLYLEEGVISSKQEAGSWGVRVLPKEFAITLNKAIDGYSGWKDTYTFNKVELLSLRNYISKRVQNVLG